MLFKTMEQEQSVTRNGSEPGSRPAGREVVHRRPTERRLDRAVVGAAGHRERKYKHQKGPRWWEEAEIESAARGGVWAVDEVC